MNISTQGQFLRFLRKASVFCIPLLVCMNVLADTAPSGNTMGGPMMNNENMREYMAENGYGYGYGGGYGGMMRGYGGMMGGGYGGMMGGGYGGMMGGYGGMMGGYGGMMGGGMMGGGYGPMMGGMMGGMYGLNLTKDQRDKIRSLRHSMRKENFGLMSKMMDARDKMAELYDTAKPDPDKVGKAFDEMSKIRREMLEQHLKMRNKIYDLLTEEQRKELESNGFGFGPMGGYGHHRRGHGQMGGMMQ